MKHKRRVVIILVVCGIICLVLGAFLLRHEYTLARARRKAEELAQRAQAMGLLPPGDPWRPPEYSWPKGLEPELLQAEYERAMDRAGEDAGQLFDGTYTVNLGNPDRRSSDWRSALEKHANIEDHLQAFAPILARLHSVVHNELTYVSYAPPSEGDTLEPLDRLEDLSTIDAMHNIRMQQFREATSRLSDKILLESRSPRPFMFDSLNFQRANRGWSFWVSREALQCPIPEDSLAELLSALRSVPHDQHLREGFPAFVLNKDTFYRELSFPSKYDHFTHVLFKKYVLSQMHKAAKNRQAVLTWAMDLYPKLGGDLRSQMQAIEESCANCTQVAMWGLPGETAADDYLPWAQGWAIGCVQYDLLKAAIACRLYEHKEGHLPTSMDDLVQAGLVSEIPRDPVDGEPFVFAQSPEGDGIVLSSKSGEKIVLRALSPSPEPVP